MSIVDNDLEKHNTRDEILMDKGRESQGVRTDLLSIVDKKLPQHNTRDEILQEKGRANLKTNIGNNQRLSTIDKGKEHNTREKNIDG